MADKLFSGPGLLGNVTGEPIFNGLGGVSLLGDELGLRMVGSDTGSSLLEDDTGLSIFEQVSAKAAVAQYVANFIKNKVEQADD
jgi:hypothetical protein